MKKPKKPQKSYDIFVFDDQHSHQRQFRVSKRLLVWGSISCALFLISLVGVTIFLAQQLDAENRELIQNAELLDKQKRLENDNDYLRSMKAEMENRLNDFQVKTDKLAMMVGMEPISGVGGGNNFDPALDSYTRPDLKYLLEGMTALDSRLSELGEAYQIQGDKLESTPSILPSRGWISSTFCYRKDPFTGGREFHKGVDISCQRGTPIYAPGKGVVTFRAMNGSYGNSVEITHGKDPDGKTIVSRFAHMDKFNVTQGQRVVRGDLVGYVGSTGRSTAPHLHYEILKDGQQTDPMQYILTKAEGL